MSPAVAGKDFAVIPPSCFFKNPFEPHKIEYLTLLRKHIDCVYEAGLQLGVSRTQLDVHDASKTNDEEFSAYANQFCGKADDPEGFAYAWLHHIHHNQHHWQHWMFADGYTTQGMSEKGILEMPHEFVLEMIADWMGASKAYTGTLDMADWLGKNINKVRLHSKSAIYAREVLDSLGYADIVNTPFALGGKRD
jgi:hypothetical protein